jgi:hypothetical protein
VEKEILIVARKSKEGIGMAKKKNKAKQEIRKDFLEEYAAPLATDKSKAEKDPKIPHG